MPAITDKDIHVFVEAVTHFFVQMVSEPAEVRSAYLAVGSAPPLYEYTGVIAVSGDYRGCIYFSAPRALLSHLLVAAGESGYTEASLTDAVGEIANTFSGNARRYFGAGLEISVPIGVRGQPSAIKARTRERPFVVPIRWRHYDAALVVDIESRD